MYRKITNCDLSSFNTWNAISCITPVTNYMENQLLEWSILHRTTTPVFFWSLSSRNAPAFMSFHFFSVHLPSAHSYHTHSPPVKSTHASFFVLVVMVFENFPSTSALSSPIPSNKHRSSSAVKFALRPSLQLPC